MTLVSLSAWLALLGAVVFAIAYGVHVLWWYRTPFQSFDQLFAAAASARGRLGLAQIAAALAFLASLGVPQAVYTELPGEVTPVVYLLTWAASAGLLGLGILLLVQGFGLAYVGARYREEPGERAYWLRVAELIHLGWLGPAARAAFHLLVGLWALRLTTTFLGAVPFLGILALLIGIVTVAGALFTLVRGIVAPSRFQQDAAKGKVAVYQGVGWSTGATILWLVALGIWLLL